MTPKDQGAQLAAYRRFMALLIQKALPLVQDAAGAALPSAPAAQTFPMRRPRANEGTDQGARGSS